MAIVNPVRFGQEKINQAKVCKAVAGNQIKIGDTVYTYGESVYSSENGDVPIKGTSVGFAKSNASAGEDCIVKLIGYVEAS